MANINKHDLSRNIPSAVQREVRQRCGFGCVVCGSAIYDYDHFEPEFHEAKEHSADGIALLCPTDHARKRKGLLSKKAYRDAIQSPKALELKGAWDSWETARFAPTISLGDKVFTGGTSVLMVEGETLLGFKQPEENGAPPRLLVRFFDRDGTEVFSIVDNRIICHSDAFDIDTTANKWIVRSKLYKVDLEIILQPPHYIAVKRLKCRYRRWGLEVDGSKLQLKFDEHPSVAMQGDALVHGPCLYNLTEDGEINMRDMEITFGAIQKMQEDKTKYEKPIMFEWPLYFYANAENDMPIEEIDFATILNMPDPDGNPAKFLPVFSSEEKAKQPGSQNIPKQFKLMNLKQGGFLKFLEQVVLSKGVNYAVLDPDLSAKFHTVAPIDIRSFIEDNKKKIEDTDPCPCQSGKNYADCHKSLNL